MCGPPLLTWLPLAAGGQLDFKALNTADVWVALITFLYLDFLDATSTMFAMARLVSENVPGFVNSKGQWPRQINTMRECVQAAPPFPRQQGGRVAG